MNEPYKQILEELNAHLKAIDLEEDDILIRTQRSIDLTRIAVDKVQQQVLAQGFSDIETEINFFKEIKPQFFCKLIYYVTVHNIELDRPPLLSGKCQRKYLHDKLTRINAFFNKEVDFYRYYRMGHTYLDDHYFVRSNADPRLIIDWCYYIQQPGFTTTHDLLVATIIANDQLATYVKSEIIRLKGKSSQVVPSGVVETDLHWSKPKIHLIELIYALEAAGAVNQGTASIKQLVSAFEMLFQADLGDVYHNFMKAKSRTNPTPFLDELKKSLLHRIEEDYH